jgi:histidinol dehydrogenase
MQFYNNPARETWKQLAQRPQIELEFLESSIRNILNRVKKSGDQALKDLTLQFDKVSVDNLVVSATEIAEAEKSLSVELKDAIRIAATNIEKFHRAQRRETMNVETTPGVVCWRKAVAIDKVGIYIPGGSAPLFSTVLMLGIPARLAECKEISLCSPPDKQGKITPQPILLVLLESSALVAHKRLLRWLMVLKLFQTFIRSSARATNM